MAPRARAEQTSLRVGRLVKAHGLKGALKLELYTDDPDRRFVPGATFSLQVPRESLWHGRALTLRELRYYNGVPVAFFEDVPDRTVAETLVRAILWVELTGDEPMEEDAWFDHQLVGLHVVRDGTVIGTVVRVEHLPAQDLLIVRQVLPGRPEREVMVPFVAAIVPQVDVAAGRVVVTPPTGLFEEPPGELSEEPPGKPPDDGMPD
ncbi:MAG: ribosome maturation factor RimM [Microbacteriaceae bacterium]